MAGRLVLLGVCAVLMAVVAAHGEAASVVVGLAKCADCTRKNMKAEAAFKGVRVAIKCRNGADGEYETKAAGELDGAGAFSVPLAADLHGADCVAQLHSAASNAPCPGQKPSRIVQLSEHTFVAVAGKAHYASPECASATICEPIKKHFFDHIHHKAPAVPATKPAPKPHYEPHPEPQPHPTPTPTPSYGTPSPYHPPAKN
ncbi:hypothetical protein E2562_015162 [Oryza meyeriana var. granulata]|uniref:Proline-rich protein n=1 Tax=Oryza meyeriana var. granulata TaxID=110450 RepID=A0A6G1EWP5_9ORYZ|nr:hypothetical protein E2562_015162 [Oryza meyeriana var. granulata]